MLNETRRLAYLECMGISVWRSAEQLSGTASAPAHKDMDVVKPVDLSGPIFEEIEKNADETQYTAHQSKSQPTYKTRSPGEVDTTPGESALPAVQLSKPGLITTSEKAFKFAFAKIPLQRNILLLAQLAENRAPGFTGREMRLLLAVLRSIDIEPVSHGSLDSQVVRWPQTSLRSITGNRDAAKDFIDAYLKGQAQRFSFQTLLVFGYDLGNLIKDDSFPAGRDGIVSIIREHSIGVLLREPEKKSALWQSIKVLKKLESDN